MRPDRLSRLRLLLSGLLAFVSLPSPASWYQVEVIVFERLAPDLDGEVWIENPGLPDRSTAINLVAAADVVATDPARLMPYLALDAARLRLDGVYRTLRLTREYRPLLHVAWQQPGEGAAGDRAVHLEQFREPDAAAPETGFVPRDLILDGLVQVRVGRFLHAQVDMVYFPQPGRLPALAVPAGARGAADYVRMRQRRKILLNELHYFDHPLFGLIVQVSRMQPDAEAANATPVQVEAGGQQ